MGGATSTPYGSTITALVAGGRLRAHPPSSLGAAASQPPRAPRERASVCVARRLSSVAGRDWRCEVGLTTGERPPSRAERLGHWDEEPAMAVGTLLRDLSLTVRRPRRRACRSRRSPSPPPSTSSRGSTRRSPRHPAGARRPTHAPQAHRERELCVARGAARDGQLAERQVRRGRAGPPVLRRLRQRRRHRVTRGEELACACSAPSTPTSSRTAASTPISSPSGRSLSQRVEAPALERLGERT